MYKKPYRTELRRRNIREILPSKYAFVPLFIGIAMIFSACKSEKPQKQPISGSFCTFGDRVYFRFSEYEEDLATLEDVDIGEVPGLGENTEINLGGNVNFVINRGVLGSTSVTYIMPGGEEVFEATDAGECRRVSDFEIPVPTFTPEPLPTETPWDIPLPPPNTDEI